MYLSMRDFPVFCEKYFFSAMYPKQQNFRFLRKKKIDGPPFGKTAYRLKQLVSSPTTEMMNELVFCNDGNSEFDRISDFSAII